MVVAGQVRRWAPVQPVKTLSPKTPLVEVLKATAPQAPGVVMASLRDVDWILDGIYDAWWDWFGAVFYNQSLKCEDDLKF